MSTDRDVTRIVRSWLEEGATALPDRVLDTVLDQLPTTPQRRAWWPARRIRDMNSYTKVAIAAAAVVVVAVVGINVLPESPDVGGPGPSASRAPSASPAPTASLPPSATPNGSPADLPGGPIPAGTYSITVAAWPGAPCMEPPQPGCTPYADSALPKAVRLTLTVPDGWTSSEGTISSADGGYTAPNGAWLIVAHGAWLLTDPCQVPGGEPDMPVGPTVDDFANALAAHPLLDVTAPVDVTLGGYSGKYVDLQVPADYSDCDYYRPWEPGVFAQGPSHQWHIWILDFEGARFVVQSMDFEGTSPKNRDELRAIVESIQIQP